MKFSAKQLMINRANAQMMIMIGIASVAVVFSLVASKALLSQRSYQSRVIDKKEAAVKQLKSNVAAVKALATAYTSFENKPLNILGGDPNGSGDLDGDNAKIVLDALPSQYDFPALATSLEKILSLQSNKIDTINGTDQELSQQKTATSPNPLPVDMPFTLGVSGSYGSIQQLVSKLQKSIRPLQILSLQLSGSDSNMHATISAKTFYQPGKSLTITTTVIK